MDKYEFIKYAAERYGIDEGIAETMVDMFADSLHDFISAGYSVNIDEIGEFKTTPLFPNGLNHRNNIALAKAAKRHIVSFIPSIKLTQNVA
jgi:nucleoid DNA-binding protein